MLSHAKSFHSELVPANKILLYSVNNPIMKYIIIFHDWIVNTGASKNKQYFTVIFNVACFNYFKYS